MHFVYVLYSPSLDKYYIGETVDPQERLLQHNSSFFKGSSTTIANDWKIILTMTVNNCSEARLIERFIKSMKSKRFLYDLCFNEKFYENFKVLINKKFSIEIIS